MNPLTFVRENIWSNLPSHITRKQQNWAALLWGLGLVAAGLLIAWKRQHEGLPVGQIRLGFILAGLAVAVITLLPGIGPRFYLGILKLLSPIGFTLLTLALILFHYFCLTPLGWVMRRMGKDPLNQLQRHHPLWIAHTAGNDRKRFYRLF